MKNNKNNKNSNNKNSNSKNSNNNKRNNNKRNNNKRNKNTKRKPYKKGGRAIAAGSFGCVFDPALKCAGSAPMPMLTTMAGKKNYISKMMFNADAEEEKNNNEIVTQYIKDIPNNDLYYLLSDTFACKPARLTPDDLSTFDEVCSNFMAENLNSRNINENLEKVTIINSPNGGLDMDKHWNNLFKATNRSMEFVQTNNALIKLLLNGIVPLNQKGINHFDVKAGNILMSQVDGHTRLIDWGLAGKNDGLTVPDIIKDRSLAFNLPISSIFFNNFIKSWLPRKLKEINPASLFADKNAGQTQLLKVIAVNMINKTFLKLENEGHYDYITHDLLHNIYKIYATNNKAGKLDYDVLVYDVLIEYIQAVLLKYVDIHGNLEESKYFYEVYSHNADIWGFLLTYAPIIDNGLQYFNANFINGLCRIFIKYCFSPEYAIKAIDANEVAKDLTSLNAIVV
jgi:hypothetical protein